MTVETKYQAARIVSGTIAAYFTQQIEATGEHERKDLAQIPDAQIIETIIDTGFWASIRREEGNSPKISLAFLLPAQAGHAILFKERVAFTPDKLIKLSLGVERPGIHLGVWHEEGELYVWGTTTEIPGLCFVLDLSEPGLLVIKHKRLHGFGKFSNVAVLSGDQIKVVNHQSAKLDYSPGILKSLLDYTSDVTINVLIQLAISMRAHKHGGTLLIVPAGTDSWQKSIIHPMKHAVSPPYSGIAELMQEKVNDRNQIIWQASLRSEIDRLAGLTAIDGATLINDRFELHAFGTKIVRPEGNARVEKMVVYEPIIESEPVLMNPAMSGGMRHLSAAQFVHDQRDALALVASQDGNFTVFSWLPNNEIVQAHRIDTLLL